MLALAAALACQPALAAPQPPTRHLVEPGDTLVSIAQAYGSTVPAILAINPLAEPDLIEVGQVLLVPAAHAALLRIEVQPDDTWDGVARQYRTTVEALRELNGLASDDRLWPGQDLLVPPRPDQPSPALPSGPLVGISTWPLLPRQGDTVDIQVHVRSSDPLSLSLRLDGQAIPLRQLRGGSYWGLAAVHVLTDPGVVSLELCWQRSGNQGPACTQWPLSVVDSAAPTYDIVLPADKGGLLDPELVRAEAERLAAIWARPETEPQWAGPFSRPIALEFVTSAPFGQKRSYNGGPVSGFHAGQDFAAPEGAPVYAAAAGTVVLAEPLIVRGNAVIVDHGAGLYSGYWHLSGIEVLEGQTVQAGDLIGLVGTTGLSTGAHLHWELRLHGVAVNPLQWVTTRFPRS